MHEQINFNFTPSFSENVDYKNIQQGFINFINNLNDNGTIKEISPFIGIMVTGTKIMIPINKDIDTIEPALKKLIENSLQTFSGTSFNHIHIIHLMTKESRILMDRGFNYTSICSSQY